MRVVPEKVGWFAGSGSYLNPLHVSVEVCGHGGVEVSRSGEETQVGTHRVRGNPRQGSKLSRPFYQKTNTLYDRTGRVHCIVSEESHLMETFCGALTRTPTSTNPLTVTPIRKGTLRFHSTGSIPCTPKTRTSHLSVRHSVLCEWFHCFPEVPSVGGSEAHN